MKSGFRSSLGLVLLLFLAVTFLAAAQSTRRTTASDSCAIIKDAIRQFGQIKAGMKRGEIEGHFKRDGGLQTRDVTRYAFSTCAEATIKVEIKFKEASTGGEGPFPKDDIVVEVSKPYLEYFTQD
jgi:hypothetical protein